MGVEQTDQQFRCTNCDRAERIDRVRLGTTEEAARAAGWRLGTNGRNEPVAYCPECSGVDEEYWDRRTLDMTYAAGIDAGNTAWGSS